MTLAPLAAALALAAVTPAAVTPAPSGGGKEVAALVARCVDAYGGKAALARSARARQEGKVTSLLHPGEAARLLRTYERSGKLRVEIAWAGQPPEVRVVDGATGWRDGEAASGPRLAAMILQAARMDLPALLSAWQAKVEDRGSAALGGTQVRVLALSPAPGLLVEVALDPATGRILRSRGASTDARMPLEFVTSYSDFRAVDGVLVAFREENYANGSTTGSTALEKVEFPAKLPASTFRP